jgi:hypothetical protein
MISLKVALGFVIWSVLGLSFATTFAPKPVPERLSGTGFSITKDGFILTSAHLVDSQSFISVRASGERARLRARLVAIDRKLDLALLKIDAKTLDIPIGDWSAVADGQAIVSLGFPNPSIEGESLKITSGIVSSRLGTTSNDGIFPFNAAVQSGNSGGPVLSVTGAVIGVVYGFSAAASNPSESRGSLSYAVNSLQIRRFLDRQGIKYVTETPVQPALRAQELFQKYEQSIFLIEARAEDADPPKERKSKKKENLPQNSVAEYPEKLRALLKTLPEREQPRIFGAYKAGYDQIEEWDDSYILIKSASIKPEETPSHRIVFFDAIISYKRERTLSSGEPYLSLIMSARFDCAGLLIDVVRQEFKPEVFGSGKSIVAKKRPADAQSQWSSIKSEKRRYSMKSVVCEAEQTHKTVGKKD